MSNYFAMKRIEIATLGVKIPNRELAPNIPLFDSKHGGLSLRERDKEQPALRS